MSLSKRHIDTNDKEVSFDVDAFALALERALPEVEFALLMGSAQHGVVKAYSDLDLAFYLQKRADLEFYTKVCQVVRDVVSYRRQHRYRLEAIAARQRRLEEVNHTQGI